MSRDAPDEACLGPGGNVYWGSLYAIGWTLNRIGRPYSRSWSSKRSPACGADRSESEMPPAGPAVNDGPVTAFGGHGAFTPQTARKDKAATIILLVRTGQSLRISAGPEECGAKELCQGKVHRKKDCKYDEIRQGGQKPFEPSPVVIKKPLRQPLMANSQDACGKNTEYEIEADNQPYPDFPSPCSRREEVKSVDQYRQNRWQAAKRP